MVWCSFFTFFHDREVPKSGQNAPVLSTSSWLKSACRYQPPPEYYNKVTRGHKFKQVIQVCWSEVRRRSFTIRVVSLRNSLPSRVVKALSVEIFKRRLDCVLGSRLLATIWVLVVGYLWHIFEWQFCILCHITRTLVLNFWHFFEWYSYFCVIVWNAICLCIVVT